MKIYNLKERKEYIKEVAELEYNEWAENPKENHEERIRKKVDKIKLNLEQPDFCKFILLDEDILVGFISIFPKDSDELPELTPWYATMYVKKEYRGKGCSKILNDAILKEAKQRGYKEIYLKSELKNYYEKFGAIEIQNITETEKLYKIVL